MELFQLTILFFLSFIASTEIADGTKCMSQVQDGSCATSFSASSILNSRWGVQLLNRVYNLYYNLDHMDDSQSIPEVEMTAIIAGSQIAGSTGLIHRYDDQRERELSGDSSVNQVACLADLEHLFQRTKQLKKEQLVSRDLNLYRLLSTYGTTHDLLSTIKLRPGAYHECLRTIIKTPSGKKLSRYCIASLKRSDWQKDEPLDEILSQEIGVCLPSSCDSLGDQRKFSLIQELLSFNFRNHDVNKTQLFGLYCLPDKASPLRAWWKQPLPIAMTCLLFIWISFVGFATMRYEQNSSINKLAEPITRVTKLFESMSIYCNFRKLMSPRKSIIGGSFKVNLESIDGIKVLSMFIIVATHGVVTTMHMIENIRDLTSFNLSSIAYMYTTVSAITIDVFFMITGLMTSYQAFNAGQVEEIFKKPSEWLKLVVRRYLRLIPVFAVTVGFNKYLLRFIGSGPFWDYGTSQLSRDKVCQQESWLWTLFSVANFNHASMNCNYVGWYLMSDIQYLAVTPIFLILLKRKPKTGVISLIAIIFSMMGAHLVSILLSGSNDLRFLLTNSPSGYAFATEAYTKEYTWPIFRATSYIVGILLGFALFSYEKSQNDAIVAKGSSNILSDFLNLHYPRYRKWIKFASAISLLGFLTSITRPLISYHLDPKMANIIVAPFWPLNHLIFALSIGLYIMLSATGFGVITIDRFLSKSFWNPLSKLSLAITLVNMNIIILSHSTMDRGYNFNTQSFIADSILLIMTSYTVAMVFHLLVEAPIKGALRMILPGILEEKR